VSALDNEPMSWQEAEAVAATLIGLGYSARAYPKHNGFGHTVVVSGKHGNGPRFRYVITDAAQLPKALDDLARGETGGSDALREGV
jgi:hypothetical protein